MKVRMREEEKMRMSGCVMKECKCLVVDDGSRKINNWKWKRWRDVSKYRYNKRIRN
jgi:hypothetical protein